MIKIVFILLAIAALNEAKLPMPMPKAIKPCSGSDPNLNQCFAINGNLAMDYIGKGDPKYNISTLLPLEWKTSLVISVAPITMSFGNILVYGCENFTISDPHIDLNQHSMQFILTNNQVFWRTQYKAAIDSFGLHQEVNGDATVVFRNGRFNMTLKYENFIVDGIQYANITKGYFRFLAIDLEYDMGILDTNPVFSAAWNSVKKLIFTNPIIEQEAGKTVGQYMNKILNVVPFNEVFTP